jgi:hypothetical protein
MSDRLEDFVKANRDSFDDKEAPEAAWENIRKALPGNTSKWYNNLTVWRAAAMVFMAFSIYLLIPKLTERNEGNKVAANEFNDIEAFYTTQISQKVALIEEISGTSTTDEFTSDFQQLEAMYNVLKEELKTRPSKKVKDALVLNLLVRINLLNQQLHRLELDSDQDDKPEEKATTI